MFNLNQAILEWRQQMAGAGIKTPAPMDELECHLREDIEKQMLAGWSAEQAFTNAVSRLGEAQALKVEFNKNGLPDAVRRQKFRLLLLGLGTLCYALPLLLNAPHVLGEMDITDRRLAIAAFAFSLFALWGGLVFHRLLPAITDQRSRTRVQIAGFVPTFIWIGIFAFVVLPRVNGTVGHLQMVILWALAPFAFAGGLSFALDEAVCRRKSAI
jgi:hypothetical protein